MACEKEEACEQRQKEYYANEQLEQEPDMVEHNIISFKDNY